MKYLSIKGKLLVLLIVALTPILSFEIYNIIYDIDNIVNEKIESSLYLSQSISSSFEDYIGNLWIQEDIISTYMLNNPDLTIEEIDNYLKQIVNKQGTIQSLFWLDNQGVVITGSKPQMIGKSLKNREFIQRIMAGEDRVLSNLIDSLVDNKPVLPIARAIRKDNILIGIVLAGINVEKMGAQFSGLLFGEDEVFSLVDKKGTIIYTNNNPSIYMDKKCIVDDSPTWEALKGKVIKTGKSFIKEEGIFRLGCSYPIKEVNWALSVFSKYDDVIKSVNKKTYGTILAFALMLFFSFFLAFTTGDYIISPIIKLKDAANNIIHGDYSVRTYITGNDEIAITAKTFDSMAESIEKHDKEKSQFFINLSHELKTPLNVILASLQLIGKIHTSSQNCHNYKKLNEQLSLMKQNCYRLIRMVSDLIDLSRHDNGYLNLKLSNHNIVNIIEDVTMSIVKYAETKKIEILFDTDTEEKIIACNPDAIERIMLNLISNALKFTEEGGSIFVNLYDKKEHILICVKDTGIGIPEDSLDSIFERFKQVDSSLSRNNEGSGIGLSLVKALVEVHDGSITVNSIVGQGSEFIIELPVPMLIEEEISINGEVQIIHSRIEEKVNLEFSDIYDFHNISS